VSVFAEIVASILQDITIGTFSTLAERWLPGSRDDRTGTLTCARCGQRRTVRGPEIAGWKDGGKKFRRCPTCGRRGPHAVSITTNTIL
jgi:hypothetical protein